MEHSPISKHYFQTLTKWQRLEYCVPTGSPAGLYLYHIDLWKDNGSEARHTFFQLVMSYLLKGGTYIISSPLKYYQDVVKSLGFKEVPGASHVDFGDEYPSPTLKLDLRGMNLKNYVKGLIEKAGVSLNPSLPKGIFNLTPREREIALSCITCSSIAEIAKKLHVTEITVKKHLGRIYEKAAVRGKTELIKKLMS